MRWSLLALFLAGCAGSPTDPTQYETPERSYARERVSYYADALAVSRPEVWFGDPPAVQPTPAAWTVTGIYKVHFNAAWLAALPPSAQVDGVVAHEVCHLTLPEHDEVGANSCRDRLLR